MKAGLRYFYSGLVMFVLGTALCCCVKGRSDVLSDIGGENRMKYASMLRMYDDESYIVAELLTPGDTTCLLKRYILVPKDMDIPENIPDGVILRTPLERLTVFSTIYTDALKDLGTVGNVSGVVDAAYITTPEVLNGLRAGKVADCGSSQAPTAERILASRSDGILYCQYEGMDIAGIDRLGIPLVTMIDNYETTPLGRAEWILFLGELVGQREKAERQFADVEERYLRIKTESAKRKDRPKVMTDNLYQGVWYVPGGKSYQARLIDDAGGDYILSNDKSNGSLNLSLEEMLACSRDADIWIMRTIMPVETKADLLKLDSRYDAFPPFKSGRVYVADTSSNDVFSLSAFHPDRMLSEYAKIFRGSDGNFYNKIR